MNDKEATDVGLEGARGCFVAFIAVLAAVLIGYVIYRAA